MSISESSGQGRSARVRISPAGTSTLRYSVKENKNWLWFEGIVLSFLSGFCNIKSLQRVQFLEKSHFVIIKRGGFFSFVKVFRWVSEIKRENENNTENSMFSP